MSSELTNQPKVTGGVTPAPPKISREDRKRIGQALTRALVQAKSQRAKLDEALELYNDMYEMKTRPRNWPWPNASNIFVPLIPTILDTTVARLAQLVFLPRLYVVKGNTPEASKFQHEVERYYNAEFVRHNWLEAHYNWIHLAARDGFAVMEILWRRHDRRMKVVREVPVIDEEAGVPIIDPRTMQPVMRLEPVEITVREYDDVWLEPVELRDFVKIPAWAPSIESATAVARRLYLTLDDLNAMVASGDMWPDAVKEVVEGTYPADELVFDEHTSTYTLGGKVDVSPRESPEPELGMTPGVFEVWRIHSRHFSFGNNPDHQEMVFFLHERTQTLLGARPYEYWHGKRPFVGLTLLPRPNRDIGFSIPERLLSTQIEINAIHNQRRDEIDLRLSPPRYKVAGSTLITPDRPWGPGAEWEVGSPTDVGLLQIPDVPVSSWQEEQLLWQNARALLGIDDPLTGASSRSGRRTKYEMQLVAASAGIRTDLMAKRVQAAMKQVFWQIHHLKIQYGPDVDVVDVVAPTGEPYRLEISKHKLIQDYELEINGAGSPLDKAPRRQEKLFLYSLLTRNPLVTGNMARLYAVTRSLLEEFEEPNIEAMIGTLEEAVAQQQVMQMMAQAGGGGMPVTEVPGQVRRRGRKTAGNVQAPGLGSIGLGG